MKRVKEDNIFLSEDDIPKVLDISTIDIRCPRCNFHLKLPESYATEHTAQQVDELRDRYNDAMQHVTDAVKEIYGQDPRMMLFVKRLEAIREGFRSPDLEVLDGKADQDE